MKVIMIKSPVVSAHHVDSVVQINRRRECMCVTIKGDPLRKQASKANSVHAAPPNLINVSGSCPPASGSGSERRAIVAASYT